MIKKDNITLKDSERTRCEIWTRVMGYFRPTDNFNIGKKQEFKDRKYYKVDERTRNLSTESTRLRNASGVTMARQAEGTEITPKAWTNKAPD